VECRTCSRTDYAPAPPQREALQRNQRSLFVGKRHGAELRGPIWMTFKHASELDAHIRKGEKGSLVVYADSNTRKETDEKTGDEIDREIPFLKGYTVFNQACRLTFLRLLENMQVQPRPST
jgi:hypothetical protein